MKKSNNFIGSKPITKIKYKGVIYKIHDDYRNIIRTIQMLEDEENEYEKAVILVQTIFGGNAPIHMPLVEKANEIIWNGNIPSEELMDKKPTQDLVQDFNTYKVDLKREYNIDLIDIPYLSWSDFLDYIGGLSENSSLSRLSKIRSTNPNDVDKKHKREFIELQKRVALKQNKVDEPRESIFDHYMKKQKERSIENGEN